MSDALNALAEQITARFATVETAFAFGELTVTVPPAELLAICTALRDDFGFEQLTDLAGVDYLSYGESEWETNTAAAGGGFSRGLEPVSAARFTFEDAPDTPSVEGARFAVAYQLLSIAHNLRLRVVSKCDDDNMPMQDSVTGIWSCADWFEREAFDLFGIIFNGHPDLRRILTDYGFIGHPFRKDFPLVGHVEMRYDPEQKRVIYEPVSIEPRVLVPKVIREQSSKPDTGEVADA